MLSIKNKNEPIFCKVAGLNDKITIKEYKNQPEDKKTPISLSKNSPSKNNSQNNLTGNLGLIEVSIGIAILLVLGTIFLVKKHKK